jgi:AcrR family transcriptional regulator
MSDSSQSENTIKSDTTRNVPTQARAIETVRKIIASASYLFAEQGIDAVSTNAIARRAEVPIGTVYKYFADKHEIIARLYQVLSDGLAVRLTAIVEDPLIPLSSPEIVLSALITEWTAYSSTNKPQALRYYLQSQPDNQGLIAHDTMLIESISDIIAATVNKKPSDCHGQAIALIALARSFQEVSTSTQPAAHQALVQLHSAGLMIFKSAL